MPHISKKKLDDVLVNDLSFQVVYVLERASKRGELKQVLKELLTPTEKIMLAKRLAVISLLSQYVPIFDISEKLSMSPSTIDIMSIKYESGMYNHVVKGGLKKTDIADLIRTIETIGGRIPSRVGRWKYLNESIKKDLIENRLRKLANKKKKSKRAK